MYDSEKFDRLAFERGSQLWITYRPPSKTLLRRAELIIRGFIAALWISKKPLTLPHARLMQQLEALGVPIDTQWEIYALYESMSGKVQTSKGFSEVVASTIGVKQGCPLSPTLFGLYIDDVSHYIERFGGSEEHYVCHCSVFNEIRGRYHCLFKQGFGPLPKVMEYEDNGA